MRRLIALLAVGGLMFAAMAGAQAAGPTPGGFTSKGVEWKGFVPFEQATSTGVTIQGKYMYLTSWKNISTYNIKDPLNPKLLDTEPLGFKFENENVSVSPDGRFLLFSEELPQNILHVYDVEDKSDIKLVAQLPDGGGHTMTCILRCKWAYGSDGNIVDLRNYKKPKLVKGANWHKMTKLMGDAHDVEEFKNGFLVTSPIDDALQILDVRNPLKPKVLARGKKPDEGYLFHSGRWPNKGRDKFLLMQGERNARTRCSETNGPFLTYNTRGWQRTHSVRHIDTFRVKNGTYADGSPAVNALGCSAHWFDEHRTFKNGGLVAIGYYEHGTRFLNVTGSGQIKEAGWFLPHGGSTSASYWVNDRIVYAVDYTRGIDILKWTGKF